MSNLQKEYDYYLKHQAEFIERYDGKLIVIKNNQIIGSYKSEMEAIAETTKHYELGTFLVQRCSTDASSCNAIYHSRVMLV